MTRASVAPIHVRDGVLLLSGYGVRLFVERGRLADRRFQPTPNNLGSIEKICASDSPG